MLKKIQIQSIGTIVRKYDVTVKDLSEEAKVSVTSVYNWFHNEEYLQELAKAMDDYIRELTVDQLRTEMKMSADLRFRYLYKSLMRRKDITVKYGNII